LIDASGSTSRSFDFEHARNAPAIARQRDQKTHDFLMSASETTANGHRSRSRRAFLAGGGRLGC
jgi:hypothetical protein